MKIMIDRTENKTTNIEMTIYFDLKVSQGNYVVSVALLPLEFTEFTPPSSPRPPFSIVDIKGST